MDGVIMLNFNLLLLYLSVHDCPILNEINLNYSPEFIAILNIFVINLNELLYLLKLIFF